MKFEDAKKLFIDKFKEVGSYNWENADSNAIVVGTNSYGIEVYVEEDSSGDFRIVYSPYGMKSCASRLESMHLSRMDAAQAEKAGADAADWCFRRLEEAESIKSMCTT